VRRFVLGNFVAASLFMVRTLMLALAMILRHLSSQQA
jgi:hypothetical protein